MHTGEEKKKGTKERRKEGTKEQNEINAILHHNATTNSPKLTYFTLGVFRTYHHSTVTVICRWVVSF